MGMLIEGVWHDQWYDTKITSGRFVRTESQFRNWITPDGSPGLTGAGGFKAEAGRYHLYVSLACPWAHRTLIFRTLKGLESVIDVSVVHWHTAESGWTFETGEDPVTGSAYTQLAPYWASRTGQKRFRVKQVSSRGGEFTCEVADDRVLISGKAVKYMEGKIEIES